MGHEIFLGRPIGLKAENIVHSFYISTDLAFKDKLHQIKAVNPREALLLI